MGGKGKEVYVTPSILIPRFAEINLVNVSNQSIHYSSIQSIQVFIMFLLTKKSVTEVSAEQDGVGFRCEQNQWL